MFLKLVTTVLVLIFPCCYCQIGLNTTCDINEIFSPCGTACPQTCNNLNILRCTQDCAVGCFCRPGTVRDTVSGKCVLPSKCPSQCKEQNAIFSNCMACAPRTCKDLNPTPCFNVQCGKGCECKPGYVWETGPTNINRLGKCVRPSECPVTCKADEVYQHTGIECTCDSCTTKNTTGCYCQNGFVRNSNGVCQNSTLCTSCGGDNNAEISQCVRCPRTCFNLFEPINACNSTCTTGCQCKNSLVRGWNGKCGDIGSCFMLNDLLLTNLATGSVSAQRPVVYLTDARSHDSINFDKHDKKLHYNKNKLKHNKHNLNHVKENIE